MLDYHATFGLTGNSLLGELGYAAVSDDGCLVDGLLAMACDGAGGSLAAG
jgi:hypothetical protein